jgi:hypothetical protein
MTARLCMSTSSVMRRNVKSVTFDLVLREAKPSFDGRLAKTSI